MCIDDYEFRHFTALRPKECRRFVFINEDEIEKTYLVNISQFQENGQVGLCKIIFYLARKGLPIINRSFYWPKFNISIEPGDFCKVPFSALSEKQIMFHLIAKPSDPNKPSVLPPCFVNNNAMIGSQPTAMDEEIQEIQNFQPCEKLQLGICGQCVGNDEVTYEKNPITEPTQQNIKIESEVIQKDSPIHQQHKSDETSGKRIKQPQRQIGQVIVAVKKWRKLYQSKKLNLTKAAKLIGISKKSLDDYYLVLRVGQILGFDYQNNMESKMGDLRAYMRTFDNKITGKLAKQVKCFDLVPQVDIDQTMQEEHDFTSRKISSQISLVGFLSVKKRPQRKKNYRNNLPSSWNLQFPGIRIK